MLVPLGIMREFGPEIMPRNFIYLYAEENDFFGLNWSKKDSHLMNYLKDEYSIDYLNRYDEVQKYLKLSSQETISYLKSSKQTSQSIITNWIKDNYRYNAKSWDFDLTAKRIIAWLSYHYLTYEESNQ